MPYELLGVKLFALPALGVFNTFLVLGVIFLLAVVIGAQFLRNPPMGHKPAGWNPSSPAAGTAAKEFFAPTEMLATPTFWLLWLTYFAGCTAGLQIIMKASPIWQSFAFSGMTGSGLAIFIASPWPARWGFRFWRSLIPWAGSSGAKSRITLGARPP